MTQNISLTFVKDNLVYAFLLESWSTTKWACLLSALVQSTLRSNGRAVVTHSGPTSEVSGSNLGPNEGKLVVAYRWLAVYST